MHAIIDSALDRRRTVVAVLILILIAGFSTYTSIPKESNPDVNIPFIYVSIVHDGISPEDAERMLVRPMENELRSIDGIKEMKATASEGHASIVMEFNAGMDSKKVLADVRDRVTLAKAKLPGDTEEPTIHEVKMEDENPTITVILSGPVPERALVQLARDIRDKLEALPEVLEVEIGGDREDIVEIIVDPLLAESYNLDQNDIYQLLSRNNQLVAAGTMDTGLGRHAVKVPAVFETIKDVMELPIKVQDDKVITFADVAKIRRSYKDPDSYARLNGNRAVLMEVKKRVGENILSTVEHVKAVIEAQQQLWPENVKVTYTNDQSEDVREMLNDLQNNVLSAIILVTIVIVAILGVRTALLVGVSIPGSFLAGILMLGVMGYTVNVVVLFALIMAVGMLVDGAIVVTEFADRCMSEGIHRRQAYAKAAQRMAWPIIASTATTLAAFAPLIFWPGMMGEFMKYLPITLIFTLTASLFMALLFVPTLGTLFGKARPVSNSVKQQLLQAETGDIHHLKGFTGYYVKVLSGALRHPFKVLGAALVLSVLVFVAYGASNLGVEFFPDVEPRGSNLIVRSHGDLSIDEKDAIMQAVEARLLTIADLKNLYIRTGGDDQVGYVRLNFLDWDERRPADEIVAEVRALTADLAGIEIEVRKDQNGPPTGKDLQLELSSRFPELLNDTVRTIRSELERDGVFVNVDDNSSKPGIEWQVNVNRADAARFGADASLVGSTIQFVTNGLKIGEYRPDDVDDELDIRVRYPAAQRNITALDELRVKTAQGMVPISNFVERKPVQKTDTIRRVDGKRVVTITADMAVGELLSLHLPRLQEKFPQLGIDPRVSIEVKGQNKEQDESTAFLETAFSIALFIMAIILVTQFNSFYQAFLILSAVLFSTVGVFLGLLIAQKPFGIVMSGIGVISLAGIVVNNNIVLIDTFNVMRKEGMETMEAILRTGAQRLRPVMLTTVTTILGLMPMVLEVNIDLLSREIAVGAPSTQWWSQLATAVAGGLAFATVLTLVLTPCMLAIGSNIGRYIRRHRRARQLASVSDLNAA